MRTSAVVGAYTECKYDKKRTVGTPLRNAARHEYSICSTAVRTPTERALLMSAVQNRGYDTHGRP